MQVKTKNETINELRNAWKEISPLSNSNCVNWAGITSDTNEFYSEVIAEALLMDLKALNNIPKVTRKKSYARENHCDIKIDVCKSNRDEENFAKRLTGLRLDELGLVQDFQIPLKYTNANKGLGLIDLISFNEETKTVFLIELKYLGNKETLLRASLESYTYFKIIDQGKLIDDCFNSQKFILNKVYEEVKPSDVKVKPAVLVVPGCNAYDELEEVEVGERTKLKALALALGIRYFTIEFLSNEIIL